MYGRIGRTGRAGATGEALSLVSADEFKQLSDIERLIQNLIPRKFIDGFEPTHDVPESRLGRPSGFNRPKRTKIEEDGQRSGENARGHKPTGKNKRQTTGNKATADAGKTIIGANQHAATKSG